MPDKIPNMVAAIANPPKRQMGRPRKFVAPKLYHLLVESEIAEAIKTHQQRRGLGAEIDAFREVLRAGAERLKLLDR